MFSICTAYIENGKIKGLSLFNTLSFFPEEITMLSSLEKLNLAWNYLEILPDSLYYLQNLKILDLIGNKLKNIHKNIIKISKFGLVHVGQLFVIGSSFQR
ncbi:MAG: hypothetical protein ACFFD4_27580, partial [Candidatus Odinarchaeota archaeon]